MTVRAGTLDAVEPTGRRPERSHLTCPFCNSYDVARLYVASVNADSCECSACGARWDEECGSGRYRGRGNPASVFMAPGE